MRLKTFAAVRDSIARHTHTSLAPRGPAIIGGALFAKQYSLIFALSAPQTSSLSLIFDLAMYTHSRKPKEMDGILVENTILCGEHSRVFREILLQPRKTRGKLFIATAKPSTVLDRKDSYGKLFYHASGNASAEQVSLFHLPADS